MELDVWNSDWGLPSIDEQCLAALAYIKFVGIPIIVKKANNPWRSPSGELPVLRHAGDKIARLSKIFDEFRKQNYDVNQTLSDKQSADVVAFTALIEQKLLPGLLHVKWVDTRTFSELTRPWYAKAVGLPFSLYLPQNKRSKVIARLHAPYLGNPIFSEADLENQVVRNAKECMNLLSTKLGNNEFFFGDSPTSFDAVAFGHLAPLLKMPLSNPLQAHLKACRNLVNFCQKIISKYFPLSPEEQETQRKQEEESRQRAAEMTEFPHRKRNMFLAGVTVVMAMAAYALYSGIVHVEFINVDKKTDAARGEREVIHMSAEDSGETD